MYTFLVRIKKSSCSRFMLKSCSRKSFYHIPKIKIKFSNYLLSNIKNTSSYLFFFQTCAASLVNTDELFLLLIIFGGHINLWDSYLPTLMQKDIDQSLLLLVAMTTRLTSDDVTADEGGLRVSKESRE